MYFAFLLLLILEDEKSGSQAKIQSGQLRGILKADPLWTQEWLPKSLGPVEDYWKLEANQKSNTLHKVMLSKNKTIILNSDSYSVLKKVFLDHSVKNGESASYTSIDDEQLSAWPIKGSEALPKDKHTKRKQKK